MTPALTCIAIAFVGTGLGYRPCPGGGTEVIIQVDHDTLETASARDPISVELPRTLQAAFQKAPPARISVSLGTEPLPQELPAAATAPANFGTSGLPLGPSGMRLNAPPSAPALPITSPSGPSSGPVISAPPGSAAAPAVAPIDPSAQLTPSRVTPANAALPIAGPNGVTPAIPGDEPVHTPPPGGPPVVGGTASPQPQDGASSAAAPTLAPAGGNRFSGLPPVGGSASVDSSEPPKPRLVIGLLLVIIALAATNGYVGWMFWDARQRYIDLLTRSFATAK